MDQPCWRGTEKKHVYQPGFRAVFGREYIATFDPTHSIRDEDDFEKNYLERAANDRGLAVWPLDYMLGQKQTWHYMLAPKLLTREAELLIEGNDAGFPANPFARP